MTKSNSVNSRKAVTSILLALLLLTAVFAQDLRLSEPEQGRLTDVSMTKSGAVTSAENMLVPVLTITPITWGVIGLDSNNVNDGPNLFPVGARVCNTGGDPATNVTSTFVWDSANALIGFRTGSSSVLSLATLAAGACTDFYYEIQVTRSATAYNTTRGFHIEVTADTLGVVSTPTPREVYVEKLVSQNRNSVNQIKLNGVNVAFGGTMNLVIGNTYTIELIGSTATNGYEQIESFINLPNVIFQTLSVASTYTAPTGYTGDKLYEDGCTWDPVPGSATYRSCLATGKTGGDVTLLYTVKVLSGAGTATTLNTLIYDYSGSSYHYNNDFSAKFVIAQVSLPPTAASVSLDGRVTTAEGNGIRNVIMNVTLEDGTVMTARTGSFGYYRFEDIPGGQTAVVTIASKRYTFSDPVRLVQLSDNVTDMDWTAD